MDRVLIFSIACMLMACGCSSISPEVQRDIAFKRYSLDCVARGIPEDTPAHTKCVMDKYEAYKREQDHSAEEMAKFYGEASGHMVQQSSVTTINNPE